MITEQSWGLIGIAAAPWLALPVFFLLRMRDRTSLSEYPASVPADAPLVSVIVPSRNEARNIELCVRSILGGTWTNIEVIVVDDHSSDGTGDIARKIAAEDSRVQVIRNPDLQEGWIGKQWACHNGQIAANGKYLLFTDADTRHGPELLARSLSAMRKRSADLFTVAGAQTMETFWERLMQPHVFGLLLARFGDLNRVNASDDPIDKIANGQFMLMRADTYDRAGGHEAVRTHVAEDLRLAQEWTKLGFSVQIVEGFDYLSTRMYAGFGEIWRGWGKNIWAAGRDTISDDPLIRSAVRVLAPFVPLWEIVPFVAIVLALAGVAPVAVGLWGAVAYGLNTLYWMILHVAFRAPVLYAPLNPLAACVLSGLFASASWRGGRVEWKGRSYVSS
jgi:chlorobactene glucosyltransferase